MGTTESQGHPASDGEQVQRDPPLQRHQLSEQTYPKTPATRTLFSEDHIVCHQPVRVTSFLDLTRVQEEAELPDSAETTIIAGQACRPSPRKTRRVSILAQLVSL